MLSKDLLEYQANHPERTYTMLPRGFGIALNVVVEPRRFIYVLGEERKNGVNTEALDSTHEVIEHTSRHYGNVVKRCGVLLIYHLHDARCAPMAPLRNIRPQLPQLLFPKQFKGPRHQVHLFE